MSKWRAGIYLRLSSDDDEPKVESNSITNQRSLINHFLSDYKDIDKYKYYVDDGYTGTDFNRPSFIEMMDDIQSRKINCVIVKDLSRLGRNYINVGNFIDDIIPRYKLRFISVNDNIDSFLKPESKDSLEVYFKNLMNENFAKDISQKVRTSLEVSKKNGKYIGVLAPFGYLKDPEDNYKFIIDEEAAKIVKRIFELAIKGYSRQEIIENLNFNHIPTPSKYMKIYHDKNPPLIAEKWSIKMLDHILKNKTYMGDLIQGKRMRINHKNHNFVVIPEDNHIIIKNHHKAIIKEDLFNHVQSILYNRNSRVSPTNQMYRYTGYLKCADCNTSIYKFYKTKNKRKKVFFYCGAYHKRKCCSKHYITEAKLDDIVLKSINQFIELISNVNDKIFENISISYLEFEKENKEFKLLELDKEETKYRKLLNDIKEDYKKNYITKEEFELFKDRYLFELNKVLLEKESQTSSKINNNDIESLKKIKKLGKFDILDRNIIHELIEVIYITEDGNVDIHFKYKDLYEDTLRYLKQNMV